MIRKTNYSRPYRQRERFNVTANQQIRYDELRVMDEQGQSLGVMSKNDALNRARSEKKDLILITDKADPPVAKIIQLSKYKYQQSQKKAQERKKSRVQDIKEIRLRPFIDENDLQAKIRKIDGFIKKNHKVKLSMELRGRAITKQDLANEILDRIVGALGESAQVETERKLIGKRIQMQLMPSRKAKSLHNDNNSKQAQEKKVSAPVPANTPAADDDQVEPQL